MVLRNLIPDLKVGVNKKRSLSQSLRRADLNRQEAI
jgi:hypothetical protein